MIRSRSIYSYSARMEYDFFFSLFNISFHSDTLWNNLKQRLIYHIPLTLYVPLETSKNYNYFLSLHLKTAASRYKRNYLTSRNINLIESGFYTSEGRKNIIGYLNIIKLRWDGEIARLPEVNVSLAEAGVWKLLVEIFRRVKILGAFQKFKSLKKNYYKNFTWFYENEDFWTIFHFDCLKFLIVETVCESNFE